jgi:pseudouridine synthase
MTRERLQKLLAEAGVASRRVSERIIAEGRVQVNGSTVTQMGAVADPVSDTISVDGVALGPTPELVYLVVHKPPGYLTTSRDDRGRPVVMDLVYKTKARVFPVGRLDMDSEGLLLLTNDGDLAQRLTHPSHEVEKEYLALLQGTPSARALSELRRGVDLEGRRTAPATVELIQNPAELETKPGRSWLRIVLKEGRKRQVRGMCESVGHPVERLIRTRIGPLRLRGLVPGRVRELTSAEVARLREAAGFN